MRTTSVLTKLLGIEKTRVVGVTGVVPNAVEIGVAANMGLRGLA